MQREQPQGQQLEITDCNMLGASSTIIVSHLSAPVNYEYFPNLETLSSKTYFEDVLVEMLLQALVGEVDAQLLEAVLLEALEPVDVQNPYRALHLRLAACAGQPFYDVGFRSSIRAACWDIKRPSAVSSKFISSSLQEFQASMRQRRMPNRCSFADHVMVRPCIAAIENHLSPGSTPEHHTSPYEHAP